MFRYRVLINFLMRTARSRDGNSWRGLETTVNIAFDVSHPDEGRASAAVSNRQFL
jgi:hypothetical protein